MSLDANLKLTQISNFGSYLAIGVDSTFLTLVRYRLNIRGGRLFVLCTMSNGEFSMALLRLLIRMYFVGLSRSKLAVQGIDPVACNPSFLLPLFMLK